MNTSCIGSAAQPFPGLALATAIRCIALQGRAAHSLDKEGRQACRKRFLT